MAKIVYPENPIISNVGKKTYIDNMDVMLAKSYRDPKKKEIIVLTKKVLTENNILQPPIGWWASPKYDGIRGVWNGKQFVSRGSPAGKSKVYSYVPDFFTKCLPPSIALDGEIFCGEGNFQDTMGLSTITPESKKYTEASINKIGKE